MRLDIELLGREMKTRRAIDSVAIEQRHRRHLVLGTYLGQFLRNRSSFEEAESRTGVEFNVHEYNGQQSVVCCQLSVVRFLNAFLCVSVVDVSHSWHRQTSGQSPGRDKHDRGRQECQSLLP